MLKVILSVIVLVSFGFSYERNSNGMYIIAMDEIISSTASLNEALSACEMVDGEYSFEYDVCVVDALPINWNLKEIK